MWFWLSLIALLCWSGSDLFSKIGCRDARDKYSHLKMVMAVGVVMGLHAAYEVFVGGTVINLDIILTYLPVSILYILSMAMGYVGLRYIELSISSPICNSSGALVAVLAILFDGIAGYSPLALFAVALVCVGAVCETAGQFAYIYAIADTEHLAMSAPIIASYCAASVLWSRIFLKEKLSWKHYAMIALIVAGIAIMGVFDL